MDSVESDGGAIECVKSGVADMECVWRRREGEREEAPVTVQVQERGDSAGICKHCLSQHQAGCPLGIASQVRYDYNNFLITISVGVSKQRSTLFPI